MIHDIHVYTYIQGVTQLPTIIQIAHVLFKNQSFLNGNVKDDLITNRTSKIKSLVQLINNWISAWILTNRMSKTFFA